jgi:MFS family permease
VTTAAQHSRLGLLRDHGFRQLFLADVGSQAGTHIFRLALPLLAILTLDASEAQVGLLAASMTIAMAVLGLPAGAIVDRLPRRRVMIVSDLARAAVIASVPVLWWYDVLAIGHLYLVAVVVGVFTVGFDVAYQSYLPHLVGRANLVEANAKLEAVYAVSMVGGRAAGGPLVQLLTAPVALLVTVGGFLSSALFIASIRTAEPRPEPGPARRLGREILEGLQFVLAHRLLRPIAATVATVNFAMSVTAPVLLIFLARTLDLGAGMVGLLLALGGVGAVLGTALARRIVTVVGHGRVIWLSLAVTMPSGFLLPWAEADWRIALVAVQQVVFWAGIMVNSIAQVSFRQTVTPEPMLGRMNATIRFLVWGLTPVGAVVGGVLAGWIGVRPTLAVAAAGASAAFVWAFWSPLRNLREAPGTDAEQAGA